MKRLFIALSAVVLLTACGGEDKKPTEAQATAPAPAAPEVKPPMVTTEEKALELIASKGCVACHALDKKVIGPAYIDVSNKYDATPELLYKLTQKVLMGGKGVWGEIPMPPNKNLNFTEAKLIVAYVLSLKNNK
jgi:cytochrome c